MVSLKDAMEGRETYRATGALNCFIEGRQEAPPTASLRYARRERRTSATGNELVSV